MSFFFLIAVKVSDGPVAGNVAVEVAVTERGKKTRTRNAADRAVGNARTKDGGAAARNVGKGNVLTRPWLWDHAETGRSTHSNKGHHLWGENIPQSSPYNNGILTEIVILIAPV